MDKTYVFSNEPSLGGCGVDPNVLALMNGNGGFGGQNGIWGVIYLAIVASIFGWNNGGFGGFGGRGCNGLPAELAGNAGRELCYLSGGIAQEMYPILIHYISRCKL